MSFVSEDDFDLPEEQSPAPAHVGRRRPAPATSKYSAQRKPIYSSRREEESRGHVSVDEKLDFLKDRLKALEQKTESERPFGARASSNSDSSRLAEIEAKLDFLKDKVKASDPAVQPKPIGVRAGASPSENKRLDDIEAKLNYLKDKVKAGETKPIGARAAPAPAEDRRFAEIEAKLDFLKDKVKAGETKPIGARAAPAPAEDRRFAEIEAKLDFLKDRVKAGDPEARPKPIGARASPGLAGNMSHIGAKVDLLEKTVNSMAAEKNGLASISNRLSALETDLKSPNGVAARLDFLRDKMKTLDQKVEAAKPQPDPWD